MFLGIIKVAQVQSLSFSKEYLAWNNNLKQNLSM
jgi:hypothetical protein